MIISLASLTVFFIASILATTIGLWKIFEKAGKTNWHSLIPLYNIWIWIKILEKPISWFFLFLIPFFGFFIYLLLVWETIRAFKKSGYKHLLLGTIFGFVYLPMLAFSKKETLVKLSTLPKIKKTFVQEWVDAILFAVVAAYIIRTFLIEFYVIPTSSMEGTLMVGDYLAVSKVSYGPKLPQTPIAFPFAHHTLPLTQYTQSYLEWIKFPYFRFPGLETVKNNDVVVFNYPDGDTVALEMQTQSYYQLVRDYDQMLKEQNGTAYQPNEGWNYVQQKYKVKARPVDKRENYIKRCVAIPGDKLQVKNGQLFVNDKQAVNPIRMQYQYIVYTNGIEIGKKVQKKLNLNEEDVIRPDIFIRNNPETMTDFNSIVAYADSMKTNPFNYIFALTNEAAQKIKALANTVKIVKLCVPDTIYDDRVFPQNSNYRWNRDNYGPIVIPQAGANVKIDTLTLPLYRRIIEVYEGNKLRVEGATVFINDKPATSYTFKMGYYWMMGDNRHNSADSRYWGFVPEDHIVGKAVFVWLSLDKYKGWFEGKIRWSKMFRGVK
ncbi:MAG: signal peptidase I [Bacteroidota bacterium]